MEVWWSGLSLIEQIYYTIAIPSSAWFLLQGILLLFGISTQGLSNIDLVHDSGMEISEYTGEVTDVSFFSLKGILAFLTFGSWTGIAVSNSGLPLPAIIPISITAGIVGMAFVALTMKGLLSLQSSGTILHKDLIGSMGKAYIPIQPVRGQVGKVMLSLPSGDKEFDALTEQNELIKTGEPIRVIGNEKNVLIVVKDIYKEEQII